MTEEAQRSGNRAVSPCAIEVLEYPYYTSRLEFLGVTTTVGFIQS